MPITYRQFAHQILNMTPEQQDNHMAVHCKGMDEAFPVEGISIVLKGHTLEDVFDDGHPVIDISA